MEIFLKEKTFIMSFCTPGLKEVQNDIMKVFSFKNISILETGVLSVEDEKPVPLGPLVRFLEEHQIEVFEAVTIKPSLEDIFVDVTGIGIDMMKKEKEKSGGKK
jgi:ABC-2 type transport system ATP-binding protein